MAWVIGNMLPMQTISVPIGKARTDLCALVKRLESGIQIVLTSYGQPKAVLSAYPKAGQPWRVATPDDPKRYGNLQTPVMEEWA